MTQSYKTLFIGPFPPPYGGIANHAKLLFETELNNKFDFIKQNTNLPFEKTEVVSERKGVNIYKAWKGLERLLFILYTERPKMIYVEMNGDRSCFREMFYMAVARFFKARVVLHFHGIFKEEKINFPFIFQQRHNWLNKLIINICFGLSHRTIFLSKTILEDFRCILNETNSKKATWIENFVDVKFFRERKKTKDKINILFVGRLSKAKGFFDIVNIARDVIAQYGNVMFHFCGSPERESSLGEIRDELGKLEEIGYIKLHGLVSGENKRKIYSEADIFLLPTHNELFPITILEALAQGLPIITTKVGVIPTIIEEGKNGCFVEVGNSESLKNKIIYLLNNPELQREISINNRKKAHERFDISLAVNKLTIIFNEEISSFNM